MTHSINHNTSDLIEHPSSEATPNDKQDAYQDLSRSTAERESSRHWWVKLFVQPLLILAAAGLAITGLGIAQRVGWISSGGSGGGTTAVSASSVDYICPMMCTPPQQEPGRCPVCAMELVPATNSGGGDSQSVQLDPAARRIANIKTATVQSVPASQTIQAVGKLTYNEGAMKTIAAWVPGRIEKLYADYTGVVVKEGDHLALVYSPELYTGQVELLLAQKTQNANSSIVRSRSFLTDGSIYKSARQRLIENGMTEEQIQQVEQSGEANSRIHLCAPASGTVIEKMAVEGEYVKEGQPIYKLADLTTIWLKLELYPEDAALIRYAQKVEITVQSLPRRTFSGRVAFIDPQVNETTRTVGVRVVMDNPQGVLKIGDYANASIATGGTSEFVADAKVYDAELAGKWLSPQHPQIVRNEPGLCPLSGLELVSAEAYGFVSSPLETEDMLVVPRNAVLMAGNSSVVYVETEPGRFEIRRVTLGHLAGEEIVVLEGLSEGENVATSGNFLIDSQMQLAGNPSLIDPSRAIPKTDDLMSPEIMLALKELSKEDRILAKEQRYCPVAEFALGSMGVPPKVEVNGQTIFLCCEGCRESLLEKPEEYLARLEELKEKPVGQEDEEFEMDLPSFEGMQMMESEDDRASGFSMALVPPPLAMENDADSSASDQKYAAVLQKLTPEDQQLARRQKICPVAEMPLGSMGQPIKVDVKGQPVFICCEGCRDSLLDNPDKYLANLPREGIK